MTRAVHLEVTMDLETDSFLKCFQRFVSRRGRPQLIVSDNATNFVGATKEIEEIKINEHKMRLELEKENIQWKFNPPAAPHFGGVYESLIKVMKRAVYGIGKG